MEAGFPLYGPNSAASILHSVTYFKQKYIFNNTNNIYLIILKIVRVYRDLFLSQDVPITWQFLYGKNKLRMQYVGLAKKCNYSFVT